MKEKFILFKLKTNPTPKVFALFYDLYIGRIYRFVYFKVRDLEDVEDITAEVFLKVWDCLIKKQKITNLNAFVYRIARNLIIDHYRKKSKEHFKSIDSIVKSECPKDESMQNRVHITMEMKVLEKQLRKLKPEYRDVIILKYIEGYSVKEVANILDKSVGATKVLLHRAVQRLKQLYKKNT